MPPRMAPLRQQTVRRRGRPGTPPRLSCGRRGPAYASATLSAQEERAMAGNLDRRVALVTGAASGIGRSSALAFAEDGARVVVADVVDEQGRETVDRIE